MTLRPGTPPGTELGHRLQVRVRHFRRPQRGTHWVQGLGLLAWVPHAGCRTGPPGRMVSSPQPTSKEAGRRAMLGCLQRRIPTRVRRPLVSPAGRWALQSSAPGAGAIRSPASTQNSSVKELLSDCRAITGLQAVSRQAAASRCVNGRKIDIAPGAGTPGHFPGYGGINPRPVRRATAICSRCRTVPLRA